MRKRSYRHRLTQLLDTVSPTASTEQQKIAALLDWTEQQRSREISDDTQPNTQPDSQDSIVSSKVIPKAGQLVDVAEVETPAPSIPTAQSSSTSTPPSPSPLELLVTQAVTDQARTFGVLASRVETIESQVA